MILPKEYIKIPDHQLLRHILEELREIKTILKGMIK
jgi:hypothetical protein